VNYNLNYKEENLQTSELKKIASIARARIILNSHKTGTPHLGSCLSCVDILVALYFLKLRIDPQDHRSPDRDRFILSKGHGAAALFQILAMKGFYPDKLLSDYGENGSLFAEHPPTPDYLPGIEAATGSLGHGLPIGLGMAISSMISGNNFNVYVLLGDGECNEGSVWEAATMSVAQKVENLTIFVDANKWQATDRSADLVGSTSLKDKWDSFGWNTCEIDGNDMEEILNVLSEKPIKGVPTAVMLNTIKGKGVSFMEDNNNWHYRIPNREEVDLAFNELGVEL
jgi:transketolase